MNRSYESAATVKLTSSIYADATARRASPAQPRFAPIRCRSMGRPAAAALYVIAMVAVVVGVDVLFFRGHFWERLAVNVGIVLVFVAFYFGFLRRA